ncbi:MAG: SDR family oxidoreductase [Candidatus Dadabacteria bacterium]|nr:MAG: SDR family oxidoreductase [Candidatus Dadabacteria bacterium]
MKVAVFGACSAIAIEVARLYAADGHELYLVARNEERLETVAADLRARGASKVEIFSIDFLNTDAHHGLVEDIISKAESLDLALVAYGLLGDQLQAQRSFKKARKIIDTNFTSVVSLLTLLSNLMEKNASGTIAVISSVAGDRGRKSNYIYGSAKGGLNIFLQGLRNRLSTSGVHVLTVKPGFVDTPMTADFKKGLLWSKPEVVAAGIVKAVRKKKDIVYLPWFWRYIMLIIRHIPEKLFKRMSI